MKGKRRNRIYGAFRLLGKYQPMYYAYGIPLIFISPVIPLVGVWMPKRIIEHLTGECEYRAILAVIGLYIFILAGANVVKNLLTYKAELCIDRFRACLQLEIGKYAMHARIRDIENAAYKEEIIMAGNVAELSDMMSILQNLFSAAVTILGLSYIIVRMNWLFFLLAGFTLGIKIVLSVIRFRYAAGMRLEEAENFKVGDYLDYLQYYCEGAGKEVRVNNAQDWLFDKISVFRDRMVSIQMRVFAQHNLFEVLQMVAVAIQNVCILLVLAGFYLAGELSVADFSLYFSAITLLSSTLSGVTDQVLSFSQKLLSCSDYHKVADMGRKQEETDQGTKNSVGSDFGKLDRIRFEEVSFSYPGTEVKVLEKVSFELRRGDRAMLVGQNGSGKTTIIKLLCKFYEPDCGKIYINDTDIRAIPDRQYYSLIATVFQDFSLFSFPISENVSLKPETDPVRLRDCLEKAELDTLVGSLKEKENTYISRLFSEDGVELSGGEKQRLGIARAVFKDAQLLVLDEPAASLDVKMEEELYRNFYHMTDGKISLTVSHRLSQASVCNKIFVLDHGVICEEGTHDELMQKEGIYSAMFLKQREAYVM